MEIRNWISNMFTLGRKHDLKGASTWSGLESGYSPKFTNFGNNILASDLVLESIRLKADFCSKLDPRHIRNENGKQSAITDSSIARILKRPNQYQTISDFLYKACFLREVNKNVFIYPDYEIRSGQRYYTSMHILQPTSWCYLEDDRTGELFVQFTFENNRTPDPFPYADLIHWKKQQEDDTYDGGGRYAKNGEADMLNTLQAYHQICESIAEASKCACFFDGLLKVSGLSQSNEKIRSIRDNFIEDLASKNGKIPVLDNSAEYQSIQRNLKFVDATTLTFFQESILRFTGVSKAMLSGDFTTAQKEAFYERCIETAVISLGQAMSKCFFSQWQETHGDAVIIYPNKIELMSTSEKTALISATNAMGVWSINEIREMYGKPPIEDGDARPRGYNNLDGSDQTAPSDPDPTDPNV